jgi:SnoaL-like domain
MTDVQDVVNKLFAIEAIKQLKARYFRLMDTKQWDDWGQVFAVDAVMEVPEAEMVNHGRAEIVANVSAALVGSRTTHHGHMPEIELIDDAHARGIWAMFDYVEWPTTPALAGSPRERTTPALAGSPREPQNNGVRVGLQGYGHYHETYVRGDDGEWRIQTIRLERLRIDPL